MPTSVYGKNLQAKIPPQAMRTPGTMILVSKRHYPIKETGLLGEIVDSKAGTKTRKDEPRLSCGICQRDSEANLKDLWMAKSGQFEQQQQKRMMAIMDAHQWNKMNIYESIVI